MPATATRTEIRHYTKSTFVVALAAFATACGGTAKSSPPPSTTVATSSSTSTTVVAPRSTVAVYFVRAQTIAAAGRNVPAPGTPDAAPRALLAGPRTGVERDLGLTSSVPTGTRLNGVTLAGAVATVASRSRSHPAAEASRCRRGSRRSCSP